MTESVTVAASDERRTVGRWSGVRAATSVTLLLLASLAMLVGGVTLYVREEILNSSAFADRAVNAVHEPYVRHVVAREIAVQILEPALPDLIAARPVVESAVDLAVGSKPFTPVIRVAAEHGHRLLFQRQGGNVVFDLADASTVVSSALRTVAPKVGSKLVRDVPKRVEAILLTLRRRSFAATTLRLGDKVRLLGIVLPPVAVVLFALGIFAAPDRRRALTRAGVAVGVLGIAFAIALEVFRRYVIAHMFGANELTTTEVRGAVGELWSAYLGDLLTWTLVATAVAWLVAAASSSVLKPYSGVAGLRRFGALARRPVTTRLRAVRGAFVLAVGLFVVLKPTLALQIGAVIGGALLFYIGLGEVVTVTAPAQRPIRRRPGRRHAVALSAVGASLVAGIIVAFVLAGGASRAGATSTRTCNGYAQLCGRRLNEVVFAGTHNSMSAADSPGWLIANQDRTIAQQLNNGIRLFKISTHYGIQTPSGRVYTDIAAEGKRVNRVAEKLDPRARKALQRFSRSLAGGSPASGKRDIWLCHSLCELGATRMVDYLATIRRFLELNPNQVVILFDEDYVAERDLESAFKRAGLFRYLARLQSGQPLPTLGSLIASHHNVVVFAQNQTSGKYAWDANGFSWIQDTPLGAKKPSQFSCKLYRGRANNPLLMMNNWADIFPPRPSPNVPLVKRAFILKRARQCDKQRGMLPNLILTDYYDRGDVIGAVNELNGVAGKRPAQVEPVRSG
jgi:hypothetical protein